MARTITMSQVGAIITNLYTNYSKEKFEQLSLRQLASRLSVSTTIIVRIRKLLANRQLLVIEGEKRNQKCYWNDARCVPNDVLVQNVYKTYIKSIKSSSKPKASSISSEKEAFLFLKEKGWTSIKLGKICAGTIIEHTIDLLKVRK